MIVTGIRDGDTLDIAILLEFGLRLADLDAPELRQEGGPEAKEFLEGLIREGGDYKVFIPHGSPAILKSLSFDRLVGYLFDGNGHNVGDQIVEAGHAKWRDYSD